MSRSHEISSGDPRVDFELDELIARSNFERWFDDASGNAQACFTPEFGALDDDPTHPIIRAYDWYELGELDDWPVREVLALWPSTEQLTGDLLLLRRDCYSDHATPLKAHLLKNGPVIPQPLTDNGHTMISSFLSWLVRDQDKRLDGWKNSETQFFHAQASMIQDWNRFAEIDGDDVQGSESDKPLFTDN